MSIDPANQPWGPDTSWGSYMPPLMACLACTPGPVLEIGCGHWSTPALHAYCASDHSYLATVEENPVWIAPFRLLYENDEHSFYDHYSCLQILAKQENWSVVLVDHSPGSRRAADALLFLDSAKFIIVHDWSSPEIREPFNGILDRWTCRVVYDKYSPSTMILSKTRAIPESWWPK